MSYIQIFTADIRAFRPLRHDGRKKGRWRWWNKTDVGKQWAGMKYGHADVPTQENMYMGTWSFFVSTNNSFPQIHRPFNKSARQPHRPRRRRIDRNIRNYILWNLNMVAVHIIMCIIYIFYEKQLLMVFFSILRCALLMVINIMYLSFTALIW